MNTEIILNKFKEERKRQNISARSISLKLGHSYNYVSDMESNNSKIYLEKFVEICELLGIDPVGLLGLALEGGI